MTLIEWWYEADRHLDRFRVGGFAGFDLDDTDREVRVDYAAAVCERLAPLVWLSMPGHDAPLTA